VKIIRKLLEDNKKSWDSKLKFSLWEDRVTTKRSIGTTPFQLVYGTEVVFPTQLALPVEKFLQDQEGEPYDMIRRMHQLVEVQQTREQLFDKAQSHQQKIKEIFDKKVKKEYFQLGDLVLKWDAQRKYKGKHGKFEALWVGPFKILKFCKIILLSCRIWKMLKFWWPSQWAFSKKILFLKAMGGFISL
jgi:hypothetical protein